jgi:hypothetical protein
MKRRPTFQITARTDAEWPQDHPIRRVATVVTKSEAEKAEFLICMRKDDPHPRIPPASDDRDEDCRCTECGVDLVRRASAPRKPKPICFECIKTVQQ